MNTAPYIATVTNNKFFFEDVYESVIDIKDIAHALSNLCRFNGHCPCFYSVAQHSVLVSEKVPEEYELAALLHDASEAYLGDISAPLKRLLPDYKLIEKNVQDRIYYKYGIPKSIGYHECIKKADLEALATEKRDLMKQVNEHWSMLDGVEPWNEFIFPVSPVEASDMFLRRFNALLIRDVFTRKVFG